MIRKGKLEEVEDYFNSSGVGQSYLKAILKGVEGLDKKDEKILYYEEKKSMLVGSAVDTVITMEDGIYEKLYHVSKIEKPSDTIKSIIHQVLDLTDTSSNPSLEESVEAIEAACETHNYGQKWKPETRVSKVIEQGQDYWKDLIESNGKFVLSEIESTIVDNIVMSFKTHEYTAIYFKDRENVDIYYQVPIYFTYKDTNLKVLLDMVIVYRDKKLVLPVDIKTMEETTKNFPRSFRRFRYDIQGSFYTFGLASLINSNLEGTSPIDMGLDESYKVLSFTFLVESSGYTSTNEGNIYFSGRPIIYQMGAESLGMGRHGKPESVIYAESLHGYTMVPVYYNELEGWEQAIDKYKWHLDNGFQQDKELAESNGVVTLK